MSILWSLSFFVLPVSIVPAMAIISTLKLVYKHHLLRLLNSQSKPTNTTHTNTQQSFIRMPSINFPITYDQDGGECWSDEDDGSDCECGECGESEEGPLDGNPSATPGVWFSCPICSSRMTQVNMCLLCEVCLATTNNLVWVSLFELQEYSNSNR
jgi:hypothetical protein